MLTKSQESRENKQMSGVVGWDYYIYRVRIGAEEKVEKINRRVAW